MSPSLCRNSESLDSSSTTTAEGGEVDVDVEVGRGFGEFSELFSVFFDVSEVFEVLGEFLGFSPLFFLALAADADAEAETELELDPELEPALALLTVRTRKVWFFPFLISSGPEFTPAKTVTEPSCLLRGPTAREVGLSSSLRNSSSVTCDRSGGLLDVLRSV